MLRPFFKARSLVRSRSSYFRPALLRFPLRSHALLTNTSDVWTDFAFAFLAVNLCLDAPVLDGGLQRHCCAGKDAVDWPQQMAMEAFAELKTVLHFYWLLLPFLICLFLEF